MHTATLAPAIRCEIRRLVAELEQLKKEAKHCRNSEEVWQLEVQMRSRDVRLAELRANLRALS
jgi:hypothetical protein